MEKDIGKISKNDTTEIVIRVDDFANRKGLTIREFVTSDRYTGFTKAGVRILSPDFAKFKEMINSITEEDMKEVEQPTEETTETTPTATTGTTTGTPTAETKPVAAGQESLPDY